MFSTLDHAHALRLEGAEEAALRLGIACSHAAPDAPGPVALLARILVDGEWPLPISEISARLVDAFVRRGDLPGAVVASTLALDGGVPQAPLLRAIGEAFAKGSPRTGSATTVQPPPLPPAQPPGPELMRLSGGALRERAAAVILSFVHASDPLPERGPLPALPLFGALGALELAQLLSTARVEEVSGGHEIVRQGDAGSEAFVVARGLLAVVRRAGADETRLAQLGAGAIFGELALLGDTPRSASVVALEPAQLLVLSREELERAAADVPALSAQLAAFCHQRMRDNLVRRARVLAGLAPSERGELLDQLASRLFEPGDYLVEHDREADCIHLIASGAVSVSLPEHDDRLVLATLGPGEVVGETSLLLRRPASADAVAIYPTVAYALRRDQLLELARRHPPLLVELYALATRDVEEIRAAPPDEPLEADEVLV